MRLFYVLAGFILASIAASARGVSPELTAKQQRLAAEFAAKFQTLEKQNAHAVSGTDGWLFLAADLRFLSVGRFWGDVAAKVSRAQKPEHADPLPAILDFRDQLKQRGIDLLLVPVPPKPAIYADKIFPDIDPRLDNPAPYLRQFYDELRSRGLEVLDLEPLFLEKREDEHGPVFCRTDTHWSGAGCVLAARAIVERIRHTISLTPGANQYTAEWKPIEIKGDLAGLLPADIPKPAGERIDVRTVVVKSTGKAVQADPSSPVLLLGDSHTLVYHEFHAEGAGLIDQMADSFGFAPDLIGTRGSGATAVRTGLYRRSRRDPEYLAKKKMIIWCFAAREFTEADGWPKLPVAP
jgi:hypothetical protein